MTLTSVALAFAGLRLQILFGASALSVFACFFVGIPLAAGAFAEEGCRKRLAVVGLLGNVAWIALIIATFVFAMSRFS
jgi:hypothetical protein